MISERRFKIVKNNYSNKKGISNYNYHSNKRDSKASINVTVYLNLKY